MGHQPKRHIHREERTIQPKDGMKAAVEHHGEAPKTVADLEGAAGAEIIDFGTGEPYQTIGDDADMAKIGTDGELDGTHWKVELRADGDRIKLEFVGERRGVLGGDKIAGAQGELAAEVAPAHFLRNFKANAAQGVVAEFSGEQARADAELDARAGRGGRGGRRVEELAAERCREAKCAQTRAFFVFERPSKREN